MAGGITNTGTAPKLLWPGLYATWGQTWAEHPEEYTDLYEILTSTRAYEEELQLTGYGLAPIKAQGASVTYDGEVQGAVTRYSHIAYALGYKVTKEEIEDNLYPEVATRRAVANAFSMRQTIENVGAFPYNNAFTPTYYTTGDGVSLISASHVNVTGGTYSNALTPSADLAESSLEDLCVQIMQTQTDHGLLINIMPQSLHHAPAEIFNAGRILKSVLQSNSSQNNINVLKATNAFPKGAIVNHYFTAPHAFFIRTNAPNGMRFFWRNRPDFEQDKDFDTKNVNYSSYMRFSVGATDPRCLFGSNGP